MLLWVGGEDSQVRQQEVHLLEIVQQEIRLW